MEKLLVPPWEKFPYDRYDLGWRMGEGETYVMRWNDWYEALPEEAQAGYQTQFPEPPGWEGFYDDEYPDDEDAK